MLGTFLMCVTCCIYCMFYLGYSWNWLCGCYLSCIWRNLFHLQLLLSQFHHLICVSWSLSWSFHAPWHAGGGLDMWCPLASSSNLTYFLTSKCFVVWKSNSVLCTIFSASVWYWHLSTMSLIHWSSWSVDLCSLCLMSLYILLMWFQYDLDTSRVSAMALKTSLGFFLFSSCLEIGRLFHHLKPSLPRKPMIVAYPSFSMLDTWRASVTWPFHSSNASCWSSTCQSNLGDWNMSCPEVIVLQIAYFERNCKIAYFDAE